MGNINDITEYVRTMKIKKAFIGGYDREDVNKKIGEVIEIFQKHVTNLNQTHSELVEMYEQRLKTSDMLITELNKRIGVLTLEQKNIDQEKDRLKGVYKEYCSTVLTQYSESLRALSSEFTQILENVTSLQKSILDVDLIDLFEEKVEALPESKPLEIEAVEETAMCPQTEKELPKDEFSELNHIVITEEDPLEKAFELLKNL